MPRELRWEQAVHVAAQASRAEIALLNFQLFVGQSTCLFSFHLPVSTCPLRVMFGTHTHTRPHIWIPSCRHARSPGSQAQPKVHQRLTVSTSKWYIISTAAQFSSYTRRYRSRLPTFETAITIRLKRRRARCRRLRVYSSDPRRPQVDLLAGIDRIKLARPHGPAAPAARIKKFSFSAPSEVPLVPLDQ